MKNFIKKAAEFKREMRKSVLDSVETVAPKAANIARNGEKLQQTAKKAVLKRLGL